MPDYIPWSMESYREISSVADSALGQEVFNSLPFRPRRLLDIGCGDGYAEAKIVPKDVKRGLRCLVGVDIDEEALDNYVGDANTVNVDMHDTPFDDDSFDVVLSSSGIDGQHRDKPFDEIFRLLRPGGIFIGLRTTRRPIPLTISKFTEDLNSKGSDVVVLPTNIDASSECYDNLAVIFRDALRDEHVREKFGPMVDVLLNDPARAFNNPYRSAALYEQVSKLVKYIFDSKLSPKGFLEGGPFFRGLLLDDAKDIADSGLEPRTFFVKGRVQAPNIFAKKGVGGVVSAKITPDSQLVMGEQSFETRPRPMINLDYRYVVMTGTKPERR